MCFHRRVVFGCGHHAWQGLTRPCEREKAFNRGEVDTGCSVMWSHGFDTTRVQEDCAKCKDTKAGQEFRLGVVKEQIKALKEHLRLIKGGESEEEAEAEAEAKAETKEEGAQEQDSSASGSGSGSGSSSGSGSGSDCGTKDASSGCASSPPDTEATAYTAYKAYTDALEVDCLEETMDEVRYDPKHRPLKLPQIVSEQIVREAEAREAAAGGLA